MGLLVRDPIHYDELWFAARMTQIQCEALAKRCNRIRSLEHLVALEHFAEIKKPSNFNATEIEQWLFNGWNTECVLRLSRTMFENEALRNSLQWAFPQAYYSTYAITVAYFLSVGFTERSHRAVIGKFGNLALQGKYPTPIGFVAEGVLNNYRYHNLNPAQLRTSLHFDPADTAIVDAQIVQFLNGTRDADLREKKSDMKLKTKAGKPKHGFNKQDWIRTSEKLGPTSVLSLLYRKRIKANYRDIDTFLANNLDPEAAFDALITVVDCANGIHEALIRKVVGGEFFQSLVDRTNNASHTFLCDRLESIRAATP